MFPRLTLTYCTQGRSGKHFSFLEYKNVIRRNRKHSCLELKSSNWWKSFEHEQNAWGYWLPANAKPAIVWIGFQRREISSRLLIPCSKLAPSWTIKFKIKPTLKANGCIVLILLWSSVIFFKFFNPLKAWKYIFAEQFGFWRFSYFRFSGFFPCPGFEMPPHLSSLEPRVPWWRQRQLK